MITLISIYVLSAIFNMFVVFPLIHKIQNDGLYKDMFWLEFFYSFIIIFPIPILIFSTIPKIFKNKLGIYSLICKLWRIE